MHKWILFVKGQMLLINKLKFKQKYNNFNYTSIQD